MTFYTLTPAASVLGVFAFRSQWQKLHLIDKNSQCIWLISRKRGRKDEELQECRSAGVAGVQESGVRSAGVQECRSYRSCGRLRFLCIAG